MVHLEYNMCKSTQTCEFHCIHVRYLLGLARCEKPVAHLYANICEPPSVSQGVFLEQRETIYINTALTTGFESTPYMKRRNNDGWCYTRCAMIVTRTITNPITSSSPSVLYCCAKFTFAQEKSKVRRMGRVLKGG